MKRRFLQEKSLKYTRHKEGRRKDEEWEQAYNEDWGYYTEWYDEYDENEMDIICNELMSIWKEEADRERGEKNNDK